MIGNIPRTLILAEDAPDRLGYDDRKVAWVAAAEAQRRYPGPAGLVLAGEINAYLEFGFRVSQGSPVARLIAELTEQHQPHTR